MLLDKREKYRRIAQLLESENCEVSVTTNACVPPEDLDKELINDIQDSIADRLEEIEDQIAEL